MHDITYPLTHALEVVKKSILSFCDKISSFSLKYGGTQKHTMPLAENDSTITAHIYTTFDYDISMLTLSLLTS